MMKRFVVSFANLIMALSAVAFEATVENQTLYIPVPEGWRRATGVEQVGFATGLAIGGVEECVLYPGLVKPNEKGYGPCRGVLAVIYNKEITPLPGTQEMLDGLGEMIKLGVKVNDGSKPVLDNELVSVYMTRDEYLSGVGWQGIWLRAKNLYKSAMFKKAPRTMYTFVGGIMIDGHIYQVQASLANADKRDEIAFRKVVERWFEQIMEDNKAESETPLGGKKHAQVSGLSKYDQLRVGDIVAYRRSKFSKSDIRKFFEEKWIDVRTLGVEKAAGVDVKLSYPGELNKKAGAQAHTVFAFDKSYNSLGLYVHMNLAVQPMDVGVKKLFSVIGEMNLTDEECAEMAKELLPEEARFLGGGITRVAGQTAFWTTTLVVSERLGSNVAFINRTYWIPAMGINKIVLMNYGVINTKSTVPPVAEFQDFIPVGRLFVNSLTVNDHAQFRSEPGLNFSGSGTGWYISSNHVVTCWHVVKGCSDIGFHTAEGTNVKLTLVDRDEFNDLALLKVRDHRYFCPNPLPVSSSTPAIAETVFTVGYPIPDLMGQDVKYTTGVISSLSGMLGDKTVMQISTPIQPGNSGGALVDEMGNIVGVVQSRLVEESDGGDALQNVNYAVKAKFVIDLARKNGIRLSKPITGEKKKSLKENCKRAIDATVFILAK